MQNVVACNLFYYESQKQYLVQVLLRGKSLSPSLIRSNPEELLDTLVEKGIIKPKSLIISDDNYDEWSVALETAVDKYNNNLPNESKWFRYDSKNNKLAELFGSDYEKCELKLENSIYKFITDFGMNYVEEEIIARIQRESCKTMYAICYCEHCDTYEIIECNDLDSLTCKSCRNKISIDNVVRKFNNKQQAYSVYADEFQKQHSSSSKLNSERKYFKYHSRVYKLNNNELISLVNEIATNIDYEQIIVKEFDGVHLTDAFAKYLIACDSDFENPINSFNAAVSGESLLKAFYLFLMDENFNRLHSLGNNLLLIEFNGEKIYLNSIDDYIDLFLEQENDEDRKKLLSFFTDPQYKKYFFINQLNKRNYSYNDLMYLIYKKTGKFVYISIKEDLKTFDYGTTLIDDLLTYENNNDIVRIVELFEQLRPFEEFSTIDRFCLYNKSYVTLSILQQHFTRGPKFTYKTLQFSTDIKEACKDIEKTVKNIYLKPNENSKNLEILKELLTKENLGCYFGDKTTSSLLMSLAEVINNKDSTLLDIYLAGTEYVSFKDTIFNINDVTGTILEITTIALDENWINELLKNPDLEKIKKHLFADEYDSKLLIYIKNFEDLVKRTKWGKQYERTKVLWLSNG